jgi:hypothetical protein
MGGRFALRGFYQHRLLKRRRGRLKDKRYKLTKIIPDHFVKLYQFWF